MKLQKSWKNNEKNRVAVIRPKLRFVLFILPADSFDAFGSNFNVIRKRKIKRTMPGDPVL